MEQIAVSLKVSLENLSIIRKRTKPRINKQGGNCHLVDFAISADHKMKIKESEKIDKYLRVEKHIKHEGDGDANCSLYTWNGLQRFRKETGGNRRSKGE